MTLELVNQSDMTSDIEAISSDGDEEDDGNSSIPNRSRGRKKPFYFKDIDDINLLREVLVEKPIGKDGASRWRLIFEHLELPVKDYKVIKRRFQTLLSNFKEKNFQSLRGSGLEEDYDEKVRLLTDIISQMDDWKKEEDNLTAASKKKQDETQKRAQNIREAALSNLSEPRSPPTPNAETGDTPKTKRPKKCHPSDVLEVLKLSEERDKTHQEEMASVEKKKLELKAQELSLQAENDLHRRDMEKRKMEIEEKRLEMEQKRFESDSKERALFLELLQKKL